jgi:hypothetical protein
MDHKDILLVESDAVYFGGHILMFQWNLLHPLSTMMMKAASSSEMCVNFYRTTWLRIPGEFNLQGRFHCATNTEADIFM